MLSRSLRLNGRATKRVLQKGKKINLPSFYIKYLVSPKPPARVSVVVSKKIDNKATKRNLIKRQIFQILRGLLSGINPAADIVISIKVVRGFQEYQKELQQWLNKPLSQP